MKITIKVSEITAYLKCPRMPYFLNKGHNPIPDITSGYLERLILKELALVYGKAYQETDIGSFLGRELDRISEEVRVIYRTELDGIDEDTLKGSVSSVRSRIENICANLPESRIFYSSGHVITEQCCGLRNSD